MTAGFEDMIRPWRPRQGGGYTHLHPSVQVGPGLQARKKSFEAAHPRAEIVPDSGHWQAKVPLRDGRTGVVTRDTLGELLDELDEQQRTGDLA